MVAMPDDRARHQVKTTSEKPVVRRETILILSQVYVPDPAANGQYLHDVAQDLVRRGHRVIALTADRGYDDPRVRYPRREQRDGVEIRRVRWSNFGKRSLPIRAVAMVVFMLHCLVASVAMPGVTVLLVGTSPPLCGVAAAIGKVLRGRKLTYWVLDLNPDQLIALGKMRSGSLSARLLDALQRFVLRRADRVVALDSFMADRLVAKLPAAESVRLASRLAVLPPWPQDQLEPVVHETNTFRIRHGLDGRFVVMYSGNHGYSTPVTTLLRAAIEIDRSDDPADRRIVFVFIGGGVGKKEVDAAIRDLRPRNIVSLPYQPYEQLACSLSAADVHVVTVGDGLVGIVHPCKVYGAMMVGRPLLLIAPDPCHASELVAEQRIGWHLPQGDVAGTARAVRQAASLPPAELAAMGQRAREFVLHNMDPRVLRGRFCDIVDGSASRNDVQSAGKAND